MNRTLHVLIRLTEFFYENRYEAFSLKDTKNHTGVGVDIRPHLQYLLRFGVIERFNIGGWYFYQLSRQ